MIQLFRAKNCPDCEEIEDALKELCLASETIVIEDKKDIPSSVAAKTPLPFLLDEGKLIQGSSNIIEHLSELESFKKLWYKYQSDACYCDKTDDTA